jgi:hypothetical protein
MSEQDFEAWLVQAKKEFANDAPQPATGNVAGNDHPAAALLTAANEVQH